MAPPTAPEGTLVVHAESVEEAEAIAERVAREQVPQVMAAFERRIVYSESVTAALLLVGLDPKRIDISMRLAAPLP